MKCPRTECGEDDNRVYRTDESFLLSTVVRYRLCLACGHRWITEEKDTGRTWGKKHDEQTIDMFEHDETYIHRRRRAQEQRVMRLIARVVRKA